MVNRFSQLFLLLLLGFSPLLSANDETWEYYPTSWATEPYPMDMEEWCAWKSQSAATWGRFIEGTYNCYERIDTTYTIGGTVVKYGVTWYVRYRYKGVYDPWENITTTLFKKPAPERFFVKNPKEQSPCEGNPCSISSGTKTETEVDFASSSSSPLRLNRVYSSDYNVVGDFGRNWTHNYSKSASASYDYMECNPTTEVCSSSYDSRQAACISGGPEVLAETNSVGTVTYENELCKVKLNGKVLKQLSIHSNNRQPLLHQKEELNFDAVKSLAFRRPNGTFITFEKPTGWKSLSHPKLSLSMEGDFVILHDSNAQKEYYNLLGQLMKIEGPSGQIQQLNYNLSVAEGGDDVAWTLDEVTDGYGQKLIFSYDNEQLLTRVTTPRGEISYSRDGNGNLAQVTYEDESIKQYKYENSSFPNHLTGIIDEKNVRYATWSYDDKGRALSSEHANGAEKVSFEYLDNGNSKTTDVSGASRVYEFELINGQNKINAVTGEPCQNCGHSNYKAQTFNAGGQLVSRTDWNDVITTYEYTNQFLTKKTIAVGTATEKVITTTWDEQLQLPLTRTEGNKKTSYSYDVQGNLLFNTIKNLSTNESRATAYTYTNGLVTSIDGPRTDVNDITTLEHNEQGQVAKITNALGHKTIFSSYNASGQPLAIDHPNNITELRTYSLRGWLLTQSINGTLTQYEYDPVGQLIKITLPNNVTQQFEYDDARRLTAIVDSVGNRTEYTVDLTGNVTQTRIVKLDGTVTYSQSSEYDKLSQLVKSISGQNVENTFGYDDNGNQISQTNGLLNTTSSSVDALSRLTQTIDPDNGITRFGYDSLDNLTSVTDAENKTTQYQYNVFGEVSQLTSPDTGITTFTYDSAGNLLTKTDARNITVSFTYDVLNRVLTQSYTDTSENISYTYDETTNGSFGVGRLTNVADQTGSTSFAYNHFGQVTKATQIIQGNSYITDYQFDTNGQLISMTYPNGRVLNYGYDTSSRFNQLTTSFDGVSQTLVSDMNYLPFGPMTNLNYGNGLVLNKNYDLDYRLKDQSTTGLNPLSYGYDLTDNITAINNQTNSNQSQDLTYDNLSRLLSGKGEYGDLLYSYDKIGNRLSQSANNDFDDYQYAPESHQLNYVTGNQVTEFTFDAMGNTLIRGDIVFTYNQQGRMATASNSIMNASYLYNFKGERVSKEVNGVQTYFIFGLQGQLIAEANAQGEVLKQYYYVNGEPYAMENITDEAAPQLPQLSEVIFDDTDAVLNGNWKNSTSVSGYTGSSYIYHAPNSPASNGIILDNDQATLSGDWRVSTSVGGYWGGNYSFHAANQPAGGEIFDSEDSSAIINGVWSTSTSVAGYNARNYLAGAAGQGEKQVTWNLSSLNSGDYQVYARWTSHSNRASNATYQVSHNNGQSSVTVNQKTNGNQWVLIGNYNLDVNSKITIDNNADGYVIADAIMVVPVGASANAATWQWQADNSDTYLVYARWTAHANRASNATYTVATDSGVSQSVIAIQKQNGGQWNLLTTITLNQGETLSVDLTDRADGYVIADAIQIVSASDNSGNTAEWSMNNVQSGEYQVYANWTQHANRATNALFNITHQNGSDTVSVNQTQNGGSWQLLGTYDINSASTISLSDVANGYVIADGIKLVPTNASPVAQVGGFYYYHNSHLGTPEVMTDESQNIVWQASYTPFGKATVEVNTVENNIRFPGQYFDAETGLHYNYFRDYDPEIGRYIQSDPIGLAGGINTYGYGLQNPVNEIDPLGLSTYSCKRPLGKEAGDNQRQGPDMAGNPIFHQYSCVVLNTGTIICDGQTMSDGPWSEGKSSGYFSGEETPDKLDPEACEEVREDDMCFETCMIVEWSKERPSYGLFGPGTNCQEYDDSVRKECKKQCPKEDWEKALWGK